MVRTRSSYLICTNPRSGSWLLADGLRSTGVAGRPEEYFNPHLRALYLRDFEFESSVGADVFLKRLVEEGTTDNGVFGAKVQRLQYISLITLLREATGEDVADEGALLHSVFPNLTLVHYDRLDRVGQALSWHRALATDNWWHVLGVADTREVPDLSLELNHVAVLERWLRRDDAAWRAFFRRTDLPVLPITYEQLVRDYEGTIRSVLNALGIAAPAAITPPALVRQADDLTEQWRREYQRHRVRGKGRRTRGTASIVVVTHNEGENLLSTVERLRATSPSDTELLVVDDHSTDGSVDTLIAQHSDVRVLRPPARLGVSGARNHGARAASGDLLVFSDAHVDPQPGWLTPFADMLNDPGVGEVAPVICDMHRRAVAGYGFTWPNLGMGVSWLRANPHKAAEVPFICGCFLAMRRHVFESLGGFDGGLLRWGSEDAELSLRVWRRGLKCMVIPDSVVAHLFRPTFSYTVDWKHTLHNMFRVASVHFPADLMAKVFERWRGHPSFPAALSLLDLSDIQLRREAIEREAHRDTEWFINRFGIGDSP